jgi:hypothetical protein
MPLCKAAEAKGMQDHKMIFNSSHFRKGINVTFRNGSKWKEVLNPGDTILMLDPAGTVINNARVFMTELLDIKHWQYQVEYLTAFEHDPDCRTFDGLVAQLDEVYGEKNWGPKVTAVAFVVDDVDPQNHHSHSEKHYGENQNG